MDLWNSHAFTRRAFLSGSAKGAILASAAATLPAFLQRSAFALAPKAGVASAPADERILVVVQLAGGNDGLNTVVPFMDSAYHKLRPSIGIGEKSVLRLAKSGPTSGLGLHPQLAGMKELYDEGLMTLVQGVGYPNPNRSHFKSMDIWHTADTTATGNGWLGRYFDNECCGSAPHKNGAPPNNEQAKPKAPNPMAGIAIGREAPLAMQGQTSKPIGFESPDLFRWLANDIDPALAERYSAINRAGSADAADPHSNAAFLMRTALDAQISSDLIRKAVARRTPASYPGNELSRQLAMVGAMIKAGLSTRVYYVTLGGFDTHAGQGGEQGRHGQLMSQLGGALKAFYADLREQGNDGRVLTMSFSEFGRRVAQNASGGTDHGAAAPMFLFGPMVKAGVVGNHPSLTDLDEGDLKYGIDFRSVYAAILEDWLKADSRVVLEGSYRPASVIKA